MSTVAVLPIPEISDLDVAFGVDALKWMPPMDEIPAEFKVQGFGPKSPEWNRIVSRWFFNGLPATTKFVAKDGVDGKAALRVIKATMGSFEPKHEHKEACCAYMLASWFEKVTGWEAKS